ncbi:hypothetical protein PSDVSF_24440 [Pseudodesulfovibrio sediminis]|uniref:Uncharacterized protein n=1 Tax=Pseudodesulfovibrio sediminis TaxID=2810563 RepID=A0ABN6ES59_9BACT|nr:hypothetical protein PSDVSF_24440 [Pseudodesulfovibrio sediminis]
MVSQEQVALPHNELARPEEHTAWMDDGSCVRCIEVNGTDRSPGSAVVLEDEVEAILVTGKIDEVSSLFSIG